MRQIVRLVLLAAGISLLLSSLCPLVDPQEFALLSAFGVIHPFLIILQVVLLVILLLISSRLVWIPAIALLCAIPSLPRYFSWDSPRDDAEAQYDILSYNVGAVNARSTSDIAALRSDLSSLSPDVVAFQECISAVADIMSDLPAYRYTYSHPLPGPAIYSKYPIRASGEIPFASRVNACIWTDIDLPEQRIRLYNLHLRSSHISQAADELIGNNSLSNKEAMDKSGLILRRFIGSSKIRAGEAQRVLDHSKETELPSIVCGDFNETPQSYTYSILAENRTDSYVERGRGLGISYQGRIPWLRIDYVLLPDSFSVLHHELQSWSHSDHAPVHVGFHLPMQEQ